MQLKAAQCLVIRLGIVDGIHVAAGADVVLATLGSGPLHP